MKFALYMHGGSGNHGCEALARTVSSLALKNSEIALFSKRPNEDEKYITDRTFSVIPTAIPQKKTTPSGFIAAFRMKYLKQKLAYVKPAYRSLLKFCDKNTVAISIGGDNYCYDGVPEVLARLNVLLNKKGTKTVLVGCSIEPELLENADVRADMEKYSLITARESLTYDALMSAGIKTDIRLIPDSAFLLPCEEHELPEGFIDGNTFGINVSPLVLEYEKENGILKESYYRLIDHILEQTDMTVALIPHVVWEANNDLSVLREFYNKYKDTGRVILVEDRNAVRLKYVISKCRFMVAARTHASIAAYSTLVPTVVVGYSVKSLGIAKDLFGTSENYVVSMDGITKGDELVSAAKWLIDNEKGIRDGLTDFIPEYIKPLNEVTAALEALK